jgi:hypothetical protein
MTTAFAIAVLVTAAGVGASFIWWMFSGAAALLDPDEPPPDPLPRITPRGRGEPR